MPTNLASSQLKDTYNQLLHVDGGPDATEKTVHGGAGTATALKLGTGSASVDNLRFDGNTISSINANGNIALVPDGTGAVLIASAAITGGSITGITPLAIAAGGTNAATASAARLNLGLGSLAVQDNSNVTITGGNISGVNFSGTFTGITSITSQVFAATVSFGYTTGAGGAVTQTTSRSTGVTLNKPCGRITLVAQTISGHEADEFTLTNSSIAATDTIIVNIVSGATLANRKYYTVNVTSVSAGACTISVGNLDNSSLPSDTLVLGFTVIKGVTS